MEAGWIWSEAVTTTPHCNGRDHWVVVRQRNATGTGGHLVSYRLSPLGLTGPDFGPDPLSTPTRLYGQIHLSPDGQWLVEGAPEGVRLHTFDAATGELGDGVVADVGGNATTFEFLESGEWLLGQAPIVHVRMKVTTLEVEVIHTISGPNPGFTWRMERGPDGNVYLCSSSAALHISMRVILGPETPDAVIFTDAMTFDHHGQLPANGLPYFNELGTAPQPLEFHAEVEGCAVHLTALADCFPDYELTWELGDGNTAEGPLVTHEYDTVGVYTITLTATLGDDVWTATQDVAVFLCLAQCEIDIDWLALQSDGLTVEAHASVTLGDDTEFLVALWQARDPWNTWSTASLDLGPLPLDWAVESETEGWVLVTLTVLGQLPDGQFCIDTKRPRIQVHK